MTNELRRNVVVTAGIAMCVACLQGCNKKESAPEARGAAAVPPVIDLQGGLTAANAEEPVVTVDAATLNRGQLNRQVTRIMMNQQQTGNMPEGGGAQLQRQVEAQVIDQFVAQTVLAAEADRAKIVVAKDDVEKALDTVKKQIPEGTSLEEALTRVGVTEAAFRADIEKDLRIRKLVEKQADTIPEPSDKDITEFYTNSPEHFKVQEQVHARHILITSKAGQDDDAVRKEKKDRAESLRKELVGGADFAALATKNSDCPSKERGGDLGTFGRGQMVKEFEETAFTQKTNEISPVVETQFGYHIIQVLEHMQPRSLPLEEVKDKISAFLGRQKKQEAVTQYIAGLKAKSKISYAAGFTPEPEAE